MNEEKLAIEKIQKTSKTVLTVTNFAKIFCIVMAVITIVSGIILLVMRSDINAEVANALNNGSLQMEEILQGIESDKTREIIADGAVADAISGYMLGAGGVLICLAIVLHFVGKVFKEFRESYSPFQPAIIKDLKVSFVLITLLSLRSSLLVGLVIGLALWCVIHIFEYGCQLQKQSDETL